MLANGSATWNTWRWQDGKGTSSATTTYSTAATLITVIIQIMTWFLLFFSFFSLTSVPLRRAFRRVLVLSPTPAYQFSRRNWSSPPYLLETGILTTHLRLTLIHVAFCYRCKIYHTHLNCLSVWIASQMHRCIYRYSQSWLAQQQLIYYYYNKTQPILIIQSLVSMLKLDLNLTKSHFLRWWAWLTLVKLRGTCSKKWLFRLKFWTESVICCLKRTISLPATVSDKSINHFRSDNSDNYIIWN